MEFRDITNLIWGDEVEKFKELVSQDFDYYLGLEDHRGVSLFYHVINSKNLELFKFLVENGADVNFLDKGDVSPIYLAAQRHSLDIFEYLFDLDVDLDTFPKYANHGVIGELCTDPEAEILLKRFIDKVDTINYKDLARVLIMEKMKLAKYIIENKNPDPVIITSSIKDLLYHDNNEVIEFLDYLLKNEFIDVNDKSIDNESIFQMVINKAEDNVVAKYLVENGIDLNIDNNGINALFSMASKNCLEGVKYYIDKGIDINSVNSHNQNALHYETSRYMGHKPKKEEKLSEVFEYLVDNGCDIALLDDSNKLAIYNLHLNKRNYSVKCFFDKTISEILVKNIEDEDKFKALFSIQDLSSNKKEKDLIIDAFSKFPDLLSPFIKQLSDDKTKLREIAVKVLVKIDNNEYLEVLKERSDVESNKSILKALDIYIKSKKTKVKAKETIRNSEDFKKNTPIYFDVLAENEASNIPVSWLKINELPDVLWKDTNKKLEKQTVKYLLKSFKDNNIDENFIDLIHSSTLVELFNIIYKMPKKITEKDIWIFNVIFILSEKDSKYIKFIIDKITDFVVYSRWMFALKLLKLLANMKNPDGLKTIDWFSKVYQHKRINNEALNILYSKAKEKNLSLEELRDSFVPNFGFNENKEITLDYGNRKIIAKLMPDFKYQFKDNTGKTFKTLPKINKKDNDTSTTLSNQKIAKESIESFKSMKKEIKLILKTQKARIEALLLTNSLKSFRNWENLYIKNPILNTFASKLFWASYPPNNICMGKSTGENNICEGTGKTTFLPDSLPTHIFKYNEDKTFTDINDEEIKLNKDDKIALVHPVDLSEEDLNKLKNLIEDYEITQPIEQVNRKFFTTNSKEKSLDDFENLKVYKNSSHHQLLSLAWKKNSFGNYNMNIEAFYINASLELSFDSSNLDYDNNIINLTKVIFEKHKVALALNKVNKRVYSEVYRSLDIVSQNRIE